MENFTFTNLIALVALSIAIGMVLGIAAALGYVIHSTQREIRRKNDAEEEMTEVLKHLFEPENVKSKSKNKIVLEDEDGNQAKVVKKVVRKDKIDESNRPT